MVSAAALEMWGVQTKLKFTFNDPRNKKGVLEFV